jgi:alpha 1,6-mannosyltransferase
MALLNQFIVRLFIFASSCIVLTGVFLYSSETYYKQIILPNINQFETKNRNPGTIPSNIIQTAKDLHVIKTLAQSFIKLNSNHSYLFFNDTQAEAFVRQHMPPHIIHAYEIMPAPVLKADYFRYISTYILGGVYSDIDTECLRPIDKWTDNYTNVSFIVGVEAESKEWEKYFARPFQLCQWTFASAPNHPILKQIIDNVAKQTTKFIRSPYNMSTVMDWTGPGVWTDTIFDYINETYHVEWTTLSKLQHGRLIGDIYFLPKEAFNPPHDYHMGGKGRNHPEARVSHYFHGSWKKSLPKAATPAS